MPNATLAAVVATTTIMWNFNDKLEILTYLLNIKPCWVRARASICALRKRGRENSSTVVKQNLVHCGPKLINYCIYGVKLSVSRNNS